MEGRIWASGMGEASGVHGRGKIWWRPKRRGSSLLLSYRTCIQNKRHFLFSERQRQALSSTDPLIVSDRSPLPPCTSHACIAWWRYTFWSVDPGPAPVHASTLCIAWKLERRTDRSVASMLWGKETTCNVSLKARLYDVNFVKEKNTPATLGDGVWLAPSREAMMEMSLCPRQRLLQQRRTGRQRLQTEGWSGSDAHARVPILARVERKLASNHSPPVSSPSLTPMSSSPSIILSTPAACAVMSSPIVMLRCRAPLF